MKRLDASKSPTRKQLVKKAIGYFEQLKEWRNFDKHRHFQSSDKKRRSSVASKSPQTQEEAYVDEDHRQKKLDKLKELMRAELAMAEIDGELGFKTKDLEKAYAGYPLFMLRRESPKGSRGEAWSVDSQGNPKRPLVDELREAVDEASKIETNEKEEPVKIVKQGNKVLVEEKLYYLEIERANEYRESPLKERFDFHQRKSKEIRRLQYTTYLDPKKQPPPFAKKIAKRDGSKEIVKRVEQSEMRFDSPKRMKGESAVQKVQEFQHGFKLKIATHNACDFLEVERVTPTPLDPALFEKLLAPEEDFVDQALDDKNNTAGGDDEPSECDSLLEANVGDKDDEPQKEFSVGGQSDEPEFDEDKLPPSPPHHMISIIEVLKVSKVYRRPSRPTDALHMFKHEEHILSKVVKRRPRIEPSPERYHATQEQTYVHKVNKPHRLTPSPDKYHKTEETAIYRKIYKRPKIEPSPENYRKQEESTYIQKINKKAQVEPSPERYHKTEEAAYFGKVYKRPRVDPSPENYRKTEESTYIKKVYRRPRIDPSPERFSKHEESAYVRKIYKRPRIEPSPDKVQQTIEKVYVNKIYKKHRCEPSPERYIKTEESFRAAKIHKRHRCEPSPDRVLKKEESVYVNKVYNKARGVASAITSMKVLEECYIHRVYPCKKIRPYIAKAYLEGCRVARTVFWESIEDKVSQNSAEEYDFNGSEWSSAKSAGDSFDSKNGIDDQPRGDDEPKDEEIISVEEEAASVLDVDIEPVEPIRIYPSKEESGSELGQDDLDNSVADSEPNKANYTRTNPNEKFPVWAIINDSPPVPAWISSPNGFLVDIDTGKMEIRTGDKVRVEPKDKKDFYPADDKVRKKDLRVDPDCDFVVLDEEGQRLPILVELRPEALKNSNCTLYDPSDKVIGRALFELKEVDPDTADPLQFSNAILLSDNDLVSEVLIKKRENEITYLQLKRTEVDITEERVVREEITEISNLKVRVITLDPVPGQRKQPELLFVPLGPFKIIKNKLLDSENANAICDDGLNYSGPILVEPINEGKDLQVFVLIPPEERNIGDSHKPKYVMVDLDYEMKQNIKEFYDLRESIREMARIKIDERQVSPPRNKRPLALDQLDLKLVDSKGREVRVNICEKGGANQDPEDSILDFYESVYNSEQLYYQLEYNGKTIQGNDVQKATIIDETHKRAVYHHKKYTGTRPPPNWERKPGLLKTSVISSPDSSAMVKIDMANEVGKMTFTGVGKFSASETSGRPKSPKRSDLVKGLRQRAATTIICYWRYSRTKRLHREQFKLKYTPIKKKINSPLIFRKFMLHYLSLPRSVDVNKALDTYMKTVGKNLRR